MLLQACLNGNRPADSHPALPVTPAALAREARASVAAGAGALHLHPRDGAGRESLDADALAAALNAVRAECPGIPVGVSSGFWILPDVAGQLAARAWTVSPEFVSVNWHEPHAEALSEAAAILDPRAETGRPALLHGAGVSAWPLLAEAGRRNLSTRTGLEDTLTLPDGTPAGDNADLVRAARGVLASPG